MKRRRPFPGLFSTLLPSADPKMSKINAFVRYAPAAVCAAAVLFSPARAAAPNAVKGTSGSGLKSAIAAQKGKVVVVNVWATWCGPCVAEFPYFVKLHNAYKAKGLTVVGASLDEPEDKPKVTKFIASNKVAFPMFMRTTRSMEEFIHPVDKKWEGVAPTTYVFDRSGKLVKSKTGAVSYQELVGYVEPLLKK